MSLISPTATRLAFVSWAILSLAFMLTLNGQDSVSVSNGSGPVDGFATVELTLEVDGDPIDGYQWGICHDEDALDIEDDDIESFTDFIDFSFEATLVRDGGWTVGALFNALPLFELEEGEYTLYEATYNLLEEGVTDLEFCDTLGTPAIVPAVLRGDDVDELEVENGVIDVGSDPEFLRGDINGDGSLSVAIIDALYLLQWQFTLGPDPPCFDAADVDDSGDIFALIDVLFLLSWAFVAGDPPPDPGPDDCGVDPTDDDDIDCATVSDECM